MIRKQLIRKCLFSGSLCLLVFGPAIINAQETEPTPKKTEVTSTPDDKGNEIELSNENEGTPTAAEKKVYLPQSGSEEGGNIIMMPAPNKAMLGLVPVKAIKEGVLVELVIANSPAEKAGLKKGDIITQVNETSVNDVADFTKLMATFQPDNIINIGYTRDGENNQTKATLAKGSAPTRLLKTADGKVIEEKKEENKPIITKEGDGN
jgi:membrane-associated protease RseP (regulator of RpoE activity)